MIKGKQSINNGLTSSQLNLAIELVNFDKVCQVHLDKVPLN